jgi:hypothetical protein
MAHQRRELGVAQEPGEDVELTARASAGVGRLTMIRCAAAHSGNR